MAWLGTWAKRLELTIDKDLIDTANLTNFPVMVYLSAASGIGDVDASPVFDELTSDANRKKIAVTSSDGTTQLYAEVEKWDDANEKAWLHVKIPSVASNADTVLYLYYDSTQSDNAAYIGDTTDAVTHNVWNSDFVAVWHMAQDPDSDTADAIKDSTSAGIDLTPNGSMTTADLVSAKVGDGIAFDGTGDCLATDGNKSSLNIGASEEFYIDFAIYFDVLPTNFGESDHIFSLANPTDDRRSYICDLIQSSSKFYLRFHTYNGTASTTAFAQIELEAAELVDGTWYHITIRRSGNLVYFYINGDLHDSGVAFNPASIYDNTDDPFYINSFNGIWSMGEFTIDEFRMTIDEGRSAAWAKATYNSLWDSLITFGAEETPSSLAVSSFLPTSGPEGISVVITGTGFTGATSVTFGGTEAASFNVDGDTQITAVVGTGSTGAISVTTSSGTASSISSYTFGTVVVASEATGECTYEGQLYEPLILNWNNIAVGAIDPINTTVSPASMSFAVGNNIPVGGADSFGELFKTYDPYYAKITITEFFDADPPTDGIEIFEGYIESANIVSDGSVQIACSGFELSISNKFSNEIVDTDTYPNADPDDVGKMLPQVYGSAERVPFRAIDIGAYSTLIADISDIVTTIEVTNAENFASTGTVQIDAEKISYTGKTDNQLTGCTRAAESTVAVTHNAGAYVVKAILVEADYFFYIIGHAVKSITAVYMDNVRQLPENYTAYTGKSGNYHADYNGYACIMFKNLSSTQTMGTVSADIEGWQDDAAGSYTGTANALIESPEAIIKHILLNRCGLSADAINPSSYATAKSEWISNSLTESIVIDSPPNVRELINRIAYEASSVEYWDAGAHNLVYLPTHTTVTKTIDANRIDAKSVDVRYTDRVDLLNSLTLWYNYYWSGYSGDDAFRATMTDSDATSISKYGTLEKEAFRFKYLEGTQNAERAIAWLLNELKNPRLIVSFTGGYYMTDIRRSNLINFDFDDGDELDMAFSGLVSTTDKFMITDIVRSVGSIEIEAVQLIAATPTPTPTVTTFYPVATSDDGVYKTNPDWFSTAGLLWMGLDYTKYMNHFIRFLNVTIPVGATITSAYVTYTASDSAGSSSYVKTSLYFNDEDSPAAPTSIAEFQALSLTSAVDWSPDVWVRYSEYNTPELKTILQEVIDRPGWNAGQAVMLVLRDNGSTSDKAYTTQQIRGAYSVDPAYSDDYMPVLHVTYTMT